MSLSEFLKSVEVSNIGLKEKLGTVKGLRFYKVPAVHPTKTQSSSKIMFKKRA